MRYITGTKSNVLKHAIRDAINYQESVIDSYMPEYGEPCEDAKIVIAEIKLFIADYQKIYQQLCHTGITKIGDV